MRPILSRRALRELTKGTFKAEDRLDDGREIQVVVTVSDDEFVVDLRRSPPQDPGAYNTSFPATMVSAQVIFRGITCPALRSSTRCAAIQRGTDIPSSQDNGYEQWRPP